MKMWDNLKVNRKVRLLVQMLVMQWEMSLVRTLDRLKGPKRVKTKGQEKDLS